MKDKIHIQHICTPAGNMIIGTYKGKLCLCDWEAEKHRERLDKRIQRELNAEMTVDFGAEDTVINQAINELEEYFAGRRTVFDIPLVFAGTEFQKRVWNKLLDIPYGQTISYGMMAAQLGCPKSVRAVANANGANAISIFAPCHRVIGSDGTLTGYGGGLDAKRFLLNLEAAKSEKIMTFSLSYDGLFATLHK